eukprot:3471069-Rhodomonas_salina.3
MPPAARSPVSGSKLMVPIQCLVVHGRIHCKRRRPHRVIDVPAHVRAIAGHLINSVRLCGCVERCQVDPFFLVLPHSIKHLTLLTKHGLGVDGEEPREKAMQAGRIRGRFHQTGRI